MTLSLTYPVSVVCRVLALPRSSSYAPRVGRDEGPVPQAIRDVAGPWPTYGYRRITAPLRRQGLVLNTKRVRRLMRALGLAQRRRPRRRRTTHSRHPFPRYPNLVVGLRIVRPDRVWVADITYVRLACAFVYLAVLMDVCTRAIRGWHLSRQLDQTLTLTALRQALAARTPEIHHSDQGIQYAATPYVDVLLGAGVRISMAAVGDPRQNGYAERLIRTIKEEEVELSEYGDYHDAYLHIGRFLEDVYMRKRIHSALGYMTPAEFEARWPAHAAATPVG